MTDAEQLRALCDAVRAYVDWSTGDPCGDGVCEYQMMCRALARAEAVLAADETLRAKAEERKP